MQDTIVKFKEKMLKDFDSNEKHVWQFSGPHPDYKNDTSQMVKEFISARMLSLLTLLEEGIEPNIKLLKEDIGNLAVEGLVLGANTERDKFRTLLAEAKSPLT